MLNPDEKIIIAVGLCLGGDFLKLHSINEEEKIAITLKIAEIVAKLDMDEEFGEACARTAGIGQVFIQCAAELRRM